MLTNYIFLTHSKIISHTSIKRNQKCQVNLQVVQVLHKNTHKTNQKGLDFLILGNIIRK
jgi:hypothetical protein